MTSHIVARSDREQFEATDWSLFVFTSVIWGASFLFIAIALDSFHPGFITLARVGLGALALSLTRAGHRTIAPEDRRRLVALSVVWVGVPFTLFPLAELHINSAVTGLLNGATPIFTAIIGGLFFSRPARGPQRLGLAIGFVGVSLVSLSSAAQGGSAFIGVLMVLGATFCYGIATNLAGPLQQRYGSVTVMARMLQLGTLWTAPFGIFGLTRSSYALGPTLATIVLGVLGTGIAFVAMATLVGRVGGPRASFITYLIPVVSLALGVVFLGDTVSPWALVGVVLVIGGAFLASRREA